MDDSDLAGPLFFCLLFGMFLLLVCNVTVVVLFPPSIFLLVRKGPFRLCLWRRSPWLSVHLCTIVFDERKRARREPHSKRFGLLPASDGPVIVGDKFVPSQVCSPRHPFDLNNLHLLRGLLCFVLTAVSVFWCTYSASAMFVSVLSMEHQRFLIAYPICLFYTCFALLTIF